MKLTILGSAAAEAVPAIWCPCENCMQARKNGGKDLRMRSAYLLDDDTIIDAGPDLNAQSVRFGICWEKILQILYTHPHLDHCNPQELTWRLSNFCKVPGKLELFGSPEVRQKILSEFFRPIADFPPEMQCFFRELTPNVPAEGVDLQIMPLQASHGECPGALNYLLRRGGHTILIANDTSFWKTEASWKAVENAGIEAAILDSTCSYNAPDLDTAHMSAKGVVQFRQELIRRNALAPEARVIANHFSHNGGTLQSKLEAFFHPHGIEVGFDGMVIELA